MSRKTIALVVALLVTIPVRALADDAPAPMPMPSLHMELGTGDGTLIGPNGKLYLIPQKSHIVTGDVWNDREAELLRLQEQETNLQAQNKSLRRATEGWQPGAYTLVAAFLVGTAGGWYLHSKLF